MEFRAILVEGIGNTGEHALFSYMIDMKDWSKSPVVLLSEGKLPIINYFRISDIGYWAALTLTKNCSVQLFHPVLLFVIEHYPALCFNSILWDYKIV